MSKKLKKKKAKNKERDKKEIEKKGEKINVESYHGKEKRKQINKI